MTPSERLAEATRLMQVFSARTGLEPPGPQRRYLWTDAFAVGNFLGLARGTGDGRHTQLALRLVESVHRVLGRYRPDVGSGWISGLDEQEGTAHPTFAGLRIGKPRPERRASEPLDDALEWERDGQYLHYLTRWIHALCQVAHFTGRPEYAAWARELGAACQRFVWSPGGGVKRSYWKMSTDLSRPLVTSMGQHDAIDTLVACLDAEAVARRLGAGGPSLGDTLALFAGMVEPASLATADPLGIGGLLVDAHVLDRLGSESGLEDQLLASALAGVETYVRSGARHAPASRRLAFREAGLAIGLEAAARLRAPLGRRASLLRALVDHRRLGDELVSTWLDEDHARTLAQGQHADIDQVMLATALWPDGYLGP